MFCRIVSVGSVVDGALTITTSGGSRSKAVSFQEDTEDARRWLGEEERLLRTNLLKVDFHSPAMVRVAPPKHTHSSDDKGFDWIDGSTVKLSNVKDTCYSLLGGIPK